MCRQPGSFWEREPDSVGLFRRRLLSRSGIISASGLLDLRLKGRLMSPRSEVCQLPFLDHLPGLQVGFSNRASVEECLRFVAESEAKAPKVDEVSVGFPERKPVLFLVEGFEILGSDHASRDARAFAGIGLQFSECLVDVPAHEDPIHRPAVYEDGVLIDLSTQPVTISYEEVPGAVAVRTWGTIRSIDGILRRVTEASHRRGEETYQKLQPGAIRERGEVTIYETIIPMDTPLEDPWMQRERDARLSQGRRPPALIYPTPWEVGTLCRDVLLDALTPVRRAVCVRAHPTNTTLWVVMVSSVSETGISDICRIAFRPKGTSKDLPLTRTPKLAGMSDGNFLERLIADDDGFD